MATLVKGESSLYVTEEVTRGTYVAPSVDANGLEPNEDGIEFSMTREEIERNTLTSTIEAVEPRLGLKNVSGSFSMEFKAGASAGATPRGGSVYKSLLGGKRNASTTTTTKASGNTTTFLAIEDADISKFAAGDIVLVKKSGAYMVRPIASRVTTPGSAGLNLAFALDSSPGNSVVIEKFTTYYHTSDDQPLSVTWYPGGEIEEQYTGMDCVSATLESWTANQTPSWSFSFTGLDVTKAVDTPSVSVDFSSDADVPVMQGAKAYLGGTAVDYIELGLSIENTRADMPAANQSTGKIGSRKTEFAVTGSINPYMASDSVARWETYNDGDTTSFFAYASNPTGTTGEFNQIVAIWLPNVKITNMPMGDQDGVLTDNIEFKAFRSAGNDSIFLGFI
jgi:hypothetical protein